jgi:hypothetical protein
MKAPTTRMELAAAIESLIGSYMDGVRVAAKEAVERAVRGIAGGGSGKAETERCGPSKTPGR